MIPKEKTANHSRQLITSFGSSPRLSLKMLTGFLAAPMLTKISLGSGRAELLARWLRCTLKMAKRKSEREEKEYYYKLESRHVGKRLQPRGVGYLPWFNSVITGSFCLCFGWRSLQGLVCPDMSFGGALQWHERVLELWGPFEGDNALKNRRKVCQEAWKVTLHYADVTLEPSERLACIWVS